MSERRGSLYLLTGLILGLGIGLIYSLRIYPVEYTDISPALLSPRDKDQYRALIAVAYLANRDLLRARARLALLKDEDTYSALAAQAQRWLAEGKPADEARALGLLAADLLRSQATLLAPTVTMTTTPTPLAGAPPSPSSPNPIPPSPSPTSSVASTPFASPQPNSTFQTSFILRKRESVCDPALGKGLIIVYVWDAQGNELPGVELMVSWEGGEDRFFTGLKPELGLGYADFSVREGVVYSVRVASGGEPALNLSAPTCTAANGETFPGVWILEFMQE
ncbi:MAG: hypothetical protein RML93_02870 [Anaerolineales bacterium]|nr:hypothetical protein [Anaerolineales bacterium]MCS7248804.1 hypothetical protein [Anaerolineales bacterium]MDW8162617.1 hypothetical protein [Anaerolineales bacterium]MDW8446216.1 hypothetical protein [Anaerolineales bacterium]